MQTVIDVIKAATELPFGFCPFSAIETELLDCRAKLRLPQTPKTVIPFLFPYKVKSAPPTNISRYAAVPDYHEICEDRLMKIITALKSAYPENEFVRFVDNSPIPEVKTAVLAGLGVRGENGLLINEKYGSFVFIGEIVTDLEIPCEPTSGKCENCGKCKAACPVGLEKSRCLSALTQKKGALTEAEENVVKENGSLWGCDICQEVCPHNRVSPEPLFEFSNGYRDGYILGENSDGRAYNWRAGAIERNARIMQ